MADETARQTVRKGVEATLVEVPFSREGYHFSHWSENSDGTGATYENMGRVTFNSDANLWAQWSPNSYTVTFNPNGGVVPEPQRSVLFDHEVGTLPTPTRTGYTFGGWWDAMAGGTQVTSSSHVMGDTTYWARWNEDRIRVTFKRNFTQSEETEDEPEEITVTFFENFNQE
jgi:Listeria/Bacterioides repeat